MKYNIPEVWEIEIDTIVLDLNGTLSVNWKIVEWVKERLEKLKSLWMSIILLTWDHRWIAQDMCDELWINFKIAKSAEEKGKHMDNLNCEKTVSIWNARIDIETFKRAKLSITTLQAEWIQVRIIEHVDIIVTSINHALDILIDWNSLCATMRT
jgi:soluble P-type ATPase